MKFVLSAVVLEHFDGKARQQSVDENRAGEQKGC